MSTPDDFRFIPPRRCWFAFRGQIDAEKVRDLMAQVAAAVRDEPFFHLTIDMTEFDRDTVASRRAGADAMRELAPRTVAVISNSWAKRVLAKLVFKGTEIIGGKERRQYSGFFSDEPSADAWHESMIPTLEAAAERLGTNR